MKSSQTGLGASVAIAILLVFSAVALVGGYVWHSKKSVSNGSDTTSSASTPDNTSNNKTTNSTPAKGYKLPAGYTLYTYSSFSLAYPKSWGDLSAPTDSSFGYTMMSRSIDNDKIGSSYLQGWFGFAVSPKASFKIAAQKYGATVAPAKTDKGYSWNVVSVNPADTTDKVGDAYTVKTASSQSGVVLYDFTFSDEGTTTSRFVFDAGDSFVTVTLPPITASSLDAVPAKDLALYTTLFKNIQNSVSITD